MFKEAKWIWYDKAGSQNSHGEFFGEFYADRAACKISCDGDYTLFVNGKFASSNQYGDFEHYKSVDEIDITPYLTEGKNVLALLVWHFGKDTQRYKRYTPGVICEVLAGDVVVFATNEDTLCRQSPSYVNGFEREISSQLGFSYKYDSTKEDLWVLGQGKSFKKAYPVDKKCDFVPRPNKKLLLGAFVNSSLIAQEENCYLYDLGREYVGLLSFELEARDNCPISISYGECLENGHVKRKIGARDFSVDYIASLGENKYTNYMLRLACRYIEIKSEKPITVKKIGLIPQYYPVKERDFGFLKGEDYEIYNACLNTLRLCMMEHYVDCPWREQCLYAFDSRNQMLSGYFAFENGNFDYARSNLLLMSKDRRGDGLLSICYPCGIDLTIPSFSLYYIVAIKEYIEASRDTEIIKEVTPKLTEIIKTFLDNCKDGLVCTFKNDCHWNFYDWSPYSDGYLKNDKKGYPDAMASILAVLALNSYKKICELCTLPFTFDKKIEELKKNIVAAFYDCEREIFTSYSQPTALVNALAVLAGIVEGEKARVICAKLAEQSLIPCSLSMKCFVYDALLKTDREKYADFVLNDIRKTYLPMLETGTVWETAVGHSDFDNAGSLCHGWSSTPIYYYWLLLK